MRGRRRCRRRRRDTQQAAFTTSTYYTATTPDWLDELARDRPIPPRLDACSWTPVDEGLLGRVAGSDAARPVSTLQVAPTIARLLGVPAPRAATAPPLAAFMPVRRAEDVSPVLAAPP